MADIERDRISTENALLEAAGEVIREEGFSALGINRIARKAGVSKVLIYRYFNNLEGLTRSWLLKNNYWTESAAHIEKRVGDLGAAEASAEVLKQIINDIFRGQIFQLRSSREAREMIRWFLCEENPVASEVMRAVEERGASLTGILTGALKKNRMFNESVDAEAVVALLISGIYGLALYSDRTDLFNGVRLDTDGGWNRIVNAAEFICRGFFDESGLRKEDCSE